MPGSGSQSESYEMTSVTSRSRRGSDVSVTASSTEVVMTETGEEEEKKVAKEKNSLEWLDPRNDTEKELFKLVEAGDVAKVKKFWKENKANIDINQKDLEKHNVLTRAALKGNEKMVEFLLEVDSERINTTGALLGAIKKEERKITVMILDFDKKRSGSGLENLYSFANQYVADQRKENERNRTKQLWNKAGIILDVRKNIRRKFKEKRTKVDSSEYGKDMTPMKMAALCGHYEIMQELYERGYRLPKVCPPLCSCETCKSLDIRFDRELEKSEARINLLKAHCNPTYLIFMAGKDGNFDPVYEAFQLTELAGECIKQEPEFIDEYEKIQNKIQEFPINLLAQCRTTEETQIFMSPNLGYEGPPKKYPRLVLALQTEQKHFVADPHAQYLIRKEYIGDGAWYTKSKLGWCGKWTVQILLLLFSPVINFILWICLFCCMDKWPVTYLMAPASRAWSKMGSYLWFCYLLYIMNSYYKATSEWRLSADYAQWGVIGYVVSHTALLIRHFTYNHNHFFYRGWNWWDMITNLLFYVTFGFWIYINDTPSEFASDHNRKLLDEWDSRCLSEITFSVATTMAMLRGCRYLILNSAFGPHQVSLGRMGREWKYYLLFYAIMIPTWTVGIQILFRPYVNLTTVKDGKVVKLPGADYAKVGEYYLWEFSSQFGQDKMVIFPIPFDNNGTVGYHEQWITETVLKIISLAFALIVGVFFATLTGSLFGSIESKSKIKAEKDIQWRYVRCREWLYYIEDSKLAPPFNLLPNVSGIVQACSVIQEARRKGGKKKGDEEAQENKDNKYALLLRKLYQRYFQYKKHHEEDEYAKKEHVEKIQGSVKRLKKLAEKVVRGEGGSNKDTTNKKQDVSSVQVLAAPKPI